MSVQPDSTDWNIINILKEGYTTNSAVAQKMSVSEGMVRQRIKRMKDAHILSIRALINPEVLANQQLAIIAVNVNESRQLDLKAKEIAELEQVLEVSIVSGQYDLFAEVLVDSNKGLVTFLTEILSKIEGISATQTFIMLKSYNKYV